MILTATKSRCGWMLPLLGLLLVLGVAPVRAQQYTGMSGLIHIPSAELHPAGEARVGAHFLNREFTPDAYLFAGEKYHTMSYYLSITPFSWLELGYTCSLMKSYKIIDQVEDTEHPGLHRKDRFFSAKIQPLRERPGKWWPSIAVGLNDFSGRDVTEPLPDKETGKVMRCGNDIFANYYVAASKHLEWQGHRLGAHLGYRLWARQANRNCDGVVGGLTFQPSFQRNLRFIAEYTGDDVNVGFDWKLWKHLLVQSSLQNGKYFSGGLCFCIQLL